MHIKLLGLPDVGTFWWHGEKSASNQRYGETRGQFDRTGSRNVEEISPVLGLEMRQYLRLVQIRASGERDDRQRVRPTGKRR